MIRRIAVLAVLILAFGTGAHAGFYVGASYLNTDSEFQQAVDSFDLDDSGYKFFGGFTIIRFLGVEASYRDMGNHEGTSGMTMADIDLEAYDIEAVGRLPLGRLLTVFGKVGYANISSEGSFTSTLGSTNFDEDDWETLYGVGVDIHFGSHFGVRAEWEEYDVNDDLNSVSVGAFFRF